MNTPALRLLSKTVYPKWIDGDPDQGPGARPREQDVITMIVNTARRFAHQGDLEDANDDLEHDDVAYETIDELNADTVFHEATFRMLVAPENWEYVHYVVGRGDAPQYHVIEIHESNSYGCVFAAGDLSTIHLLIDDGTFAAERPEARALEAPLYDLVYG